MATKKNNADPSMLAVTRRIINEIKAKAEGLDLDSIIADSISKSRGKNGRNVDFGPVAYDFIFKHIFTSAIMGPVGSGKTVACMFKLLFTSMAMKRGKNGKRQSRWYIVRNTQEQLERTTIATFMEWFSDLGTFHKTDMMFKMRFDDVEADFIFLALDTAKDARKLLSRECTGIYFNELSEINVEIWNTAKERVGRFPAPVSGTKCWLDFEKLQSLGFDIDRSEIEFHKIKIPVDKIVGNKVTKVMEEIEYPFVLAPCVFGDTNPPMIGSYYQQLFEGELRNDEGESIQPKDFLFFRQPSGRSPEAENINNLPKGYYDRIIRNSSPNKIRKMVDVQYDIGDEGLPVYKGYFKKDVHVKSDLRKKHYTTKMKLLIGMDFGLTPAVVIGQLVDGKFMVYDELYVKKNVKMPVIKFLDEMFSVFMQKNYPAHMRNKENILFAIDPAGRYADQISGFKAYDEIKKRGYSCNVDSSNRNDERISSVIKLLSLNSKDEPNFYIDEKCEHIINGLDGNYYFEKDKDTFKTKPCKNHFSHIQDALQYACVHIDKKRDKDLRVRFDSRDNNFYNSIYDTPLDDEIGY